MAYLKHLDKCYTQIEVWHVTADQAGAINQPNGHNCTHVLFARHVDCFSAIEESRCSGEDLSGDGCEYHVPCCEKYGCCAQRKITEMTEKCDG